MKRSSASGLLAAILTLNLATALPLRAQVLTLDPGFDPNHVLDDEDIFDANGMSYDRMVRFLKSKGTLADTKQVDIDGVLKPVPDIIWRVATSYKINPKYLLVLLQKEQSLVEDSSPSQKQLDWATGFAVCDSCSKNDPSIQEFKGFASQLEWAAKQHREKYLMQILVTGKTKSGKAAGLSMNVDGQSVTPENNATAMLYTYTPHISGNQNLWRIWKRWFSLNFPDGTLVRAKDSKTTYMIRLGQKRPFASRAVFESLADPDKVVTVSDTELSSYPDGPVIQFPKFALLRDEKSTVWLLSGDTRRAIADMKTFRKFGFNEDEVMDVESADLADYTVGNPITQKTEFPQGVVVQEKGTKNYWYVEDEVRHQIPDKVFLSLYFRGRTPKAVTTKKLETYKIGDPYRLQNGELVRNISSPAVYVVENGQLRPIPSADVFEALGWKWKNVIKIPDAVLSSYTVSDPVDQLRPAPAADTILTDTSTTTTSSTLPTNTLGSL